MRFSVAAVTLFTLATSALSAVIPPTVEKYDGETNGNYIVQLREDADKAKLLEQVKASHGEVTYDYSVINGFAGVFSKDTLKMILESPLVESVSEDGLMTASGIQTNAPWGLARISDKLGGGTDPSALNYQYYYPDNTLGAGTDIYVVDTGVRISHVTFGGRARWGATFGPYGNADGNGHGTHCAGTAAGNQHGVAKNANIIAVKVLSDQGSGSISDIIAGLNFVWVSSRVSRRPSIVNLSLGGGASPPLDAAVRWLTLNGVHVAVAAGNDNKDAGNTSPAREGSAVTVGASTIKDERAYFSNYGSVVDIFAPGRFITSAWIDNDTATKSISGTSMATPHVAGLMAYLIGAQGNIPTAAMSAKLQGLAKKNVLSDIPSGTVNLLAQNH